MEARDSMGYYRENTLDSPRDDAELAKGTQSEHELYQLVNCKEIGERLGQCYAANKGLYGCEKFMEQFDQCRRAEIQEQMKRNSDQEWLEFREQYVQKKREKIRKEMMEGLDKDVQRSKWFS